MSSKIRKIDFYPDEFVAGVAAKLDPVEAGVYWMVCSLIYSHGGPIDDDPKWLAGLFRQTNPRTVRAALERLIAAGKIQRIGAELMVNRCRIELERTSKRIRTASENGAKGGRPTKRFEENQGVAKPNPFSDKKLTKQLPTSNHQPEYINGASDGDSDDELGFDVPGGVNSADAEETPPAGTHTRTREADGPAYPSDFERAWEAYPKRDGSNPKSEALKAWRARRREGRSADELAEGAERYARWCDATGKTGTETVMQARRFFGPADPPHFSLAWDVPGSTGPPQGPVGVAAILAEMQAGGGGSGG